MSTTKDKTVFEIDSLIKEVYTDIANWHNDDSSQPGLKQLTLELIEKISTAAFEHVGLSANLSVYKDEDTAKKMEEIRRKKD